MTSKIVTLAAAVMAVGLFCRSAIAGENWPASVVGTWDAIADQSPLTITISSQASSGRCRAISGTIVDLVNGTSNLVGFYCPTTGRFNFARNDPTSGVTFQDYSGNVSDNGSTLYMGGVFAQVVQLVGEYNFSASK
jgi:hypothetical protein